MSAPEVLVRLTDVKAHFPIRSGLMRRVTGHVHAVDGVSIDIYRGEVLGLVGESGCGKTTLGKAILQLVRTSAGSIAYRADGTEADLTRLDRHGLAPYRRRMQIVFQDPHSSLNPAFTIFGSLEDPLRQSGIRSRGERRKVVGDLLELVNMRRDHMDRYPHEFSGGQRQRIGIARALSLNPELVVCDEAVSALDVSIQAQVLQLLMALKRDKGLTYVFITHDLGVTEYICDRIAVMYLGRIVELGDTANLFTQRMHPYTEALLSAVPVAALGRKRSRIVLQGDVPNPVRPPAGCPFHPRCPKVQTICSREVPVLREFTVAGRPHAAACHFAEVRA